ncbi:MAG: hypothetical protein Q4E91_01165 [Lachnospiraceae bacterium]|nr:hypothetical protein [Lachnospiraceae bacterium]
MERLRRIMKPMLFLLMAAVILLLPAAETKAASAVDVISSARNAGTPSGKLKETAKGVRYCYANGKYAKNKWLYVKGNVYYFSSKGYAATGWFVYQKKTYYANADGQVYAGKWLTQSGKRYYLKKNGVRAAKEWVNRNGKYYYFNSKGVLFRSCQFSVGGKYYYANKNGVRKANCWVTIKGERYYFGKNGVRYQNKWVKYKGKYYYLKKNGVMARDSWVGSYYVGSDGARKTNCCFGGYYLDSTGKRQSALRFSGKYLIVGDSRVVGMDAAVSTSQAKFIGKVSMGYTWLKSTAGLQVKRYLAGNQKLKVVFAFGINDLGNISQYISYYKSLMKEFPDTEFYFMSVNPVKEDQASAYGYTVKNSAIQSFNKKMKSAFGSRYINAYSYLMKQGFSAVDGIHYTGATYQKLYKYIISEIK